MALVLGGTTALSGLLLGGANHLTEEPRKEAETAKNMKALANVAGSFNNNPQAEATEINLPSGQTATVYPAKANGKLTGIAVESLSMNGFSGEVRIMTGFDLEGRITGYEVLKQSETPGLGAKMPEWFSPKGQGDITGMNPSIKPLKVTKDGGEIDGITAATISSRAFLETVNTASEAYRIYLQQYKEAAE